MINIQILFTVFIHLNFVRESSEDSLSLVLRDQFFISHELFFMITNGDYCEEIFDVDHSCGFKD